jgi:hypothetical protein
MQSAATTDIPAAGYRARRFARFERDLAAWQASPHGQFAVWRAQRQLAGAPAFCADAEQRAQRPRSTSSA